jgi:uncharacterized membrane protein YobD (UPF0266 family)
MASLIPGIFIATLATLVIVTFGVLVYYALRTKGDVIAELSHGKTSLRIAAKDKRRNDKQLHE